MTITDGFWFQVGRGFAELAMAFGIIFFIFFVTIIVSIFNAWRNGKI